MKHIVPFWGGFLAAPAMAHSGAHPHSHGEYAWIAVVLSAVIVGGTMTVVRKRRRT